MIGLQFLHGNSICLLCLTPSLQVATAPKSSTTSPQVAKDPVPKAGLRKHLKIYCFLEDLCLEVVRTVKKAYWKFRAMPAASLKWKSYEKAPSHA